MDIWFKDESTVSVPKDLKDLLKAATNYYQSEEWRTSVTLSAIVTESILADIYEEEMKVDAPDVPLGALVEQVKKSVKIPKQIDSAIKNLNQARIAAVHRSKSPVSDRDAEIALFSATKTLIWFMNKY